MKNTPLTHHDFDVLIIGAGGAGLRAAVAASAKGAKVAVVSKVSPTRSHTVAAQGGINAALGNRTEDDWRWHAFDTIKGSDYLADEDAVQIMCERAPAAIAELEHMGMPFSRGDDGRIYQRAYGGQNTDFGRGGPAYRACAVADRTGHSLLHTLYAQAVKFGVRFFSEFMALDLLMEEGACGGVLAWELETGALHVFAAATTIIATGGFGQAFAATTASSICTGDGGGMALRAGISLQDMEFIQFHPTGLYGAGVLITEAARGEGAILLNSLGERFMERYSPVHKELASRDLISRAMMQEIGEGRGCGKLKDHLHLQLSHLARDVIDTKLPTIKTLAAQFAKVDVYRDPVPVVPTVHYTMGGIPTDAQGNVMGHESWVMGKNTIPMTHDPKPMTRIPGLMAIGEAASTSVHGANRLGCNGLLELVVFGKIAGELAAELGQRQKAKGKSEMALAHFERLRQASGSKRPVYFRKNLQSVMQTHANIFRDGESLAAGLVKLQILQKEFDSDLLVSDKSLMFNNDLLEAIEAENVLLQAIACMASALKREESRGAHFRKDFPARDDERWRVHSRAVVDGGAIGYDCNPVRLLFQETA